ncbi:MAG: hypothetical protein RMY62_030590 [Nostoc sp. ZfuVER08]|nr:hypothetical protein [Nostoc sp. ZfuVER08]
MFIEIEERLPLLEEILGRWKNEVGNDYVGYKNHVYRMIHFCLAQRDFDSVAREKIIIAGCFHDLGIWSNDTFDYLPPSVALAKDYLWQNSLEQWIPEIELMIGTHHKLRKYEDMENPLVEVFRKGDLVDFSLGFVKCGLSKSYIRSVKKQFPNAGFHKCLAQTASSWCLKHPLNPIPVLKW